MRQVREQHLKYPEIARRTGVNVNTIKRWASVPIKFIGTGKGLALTVDEELDFIACLHHLADYWFPVNRKTLMDLVQSYLKYGNKKNPFKDDRPGKDWCAQFELRHRNVLRYTKREPLSKARASGMHPDNIEQFYKMYYDTLLKNNLLHMPWLIFNVDETGLQACHGWSKVYHRGRVQASIFYCSQFHQGFIHGEFLLQCYWAVFTTLHRV